ncbi:MAG: hypothetical protein GKS05_10440 [Nitrospirales bacterium]|nr:hypothetical protein [Nitrospirales bacterium]
MKAIRGCATSFVHPDQHPIHVMAQFDQIVGWTDQSILDGYEGIHQFLSQNTQLQQAQSVMTLSLGGHIILPISFSYDRDLPKGSQFFNLTTALNSYLAAQSPPPDPLMLPLTFTAATRGMITVYLPQIDYHA